MPFALLLGPIAISQSLGLLEQFLDLLASRAYLHLQKLENCLVVIFFQYQVLAVRDTDFYVVGCTL